MMGLENNIGLEKLATNWEFLCLELERPSVIVGNYFEKNYQVAPKRIKISPKRHGSKPEITNLLYSGINQEIIKSKKPTFSVYGHGRYHHYTYGLCRVLATQRSDDFGYIHFDRHHDMWDDSDVHDVSHIGCARFVKSIKRDSASDVLLVGTFEGDYTELSDEKMFFAPILFLRKYLKKLPEDVYISFDLDVMKTSLMATGWPGGKLGKRKLFRLIREIKKEKNIIGVDVLGYNLEENSSPLAQRSLQLYAEIAKEIVS